MKEKYYITTAIVYTSGKPHIGNAYDVVVADCIARFKREQGFDVFFMTGTDEHGQKIELKAIANNKTPKDYVDEIVKVIKDVYASLNISYDKFIRTTDEDHVKTCQKIFKKLYDNGDIYKDVYEGWYCTPCESFFTENQLVEGKCPDCGTKVEKAKEEAYFFNMQKYADRLIKYFNENEFEILPNSRKNEMLNNFLLPGLKDLCVSRTSFNWGIQVPFDEKHVIYVWLDALMNYITGIGFDVDNPSELFNKNWPCDLHVIGKDIVRFHTIYWPIFLMALGLPMPKKIFGHPWLLAKSKEVEDENIKMSKSKGNVLYPDDLAKVFGTDGVRFYLLHEMPYENDGVVNLYVLCERYNTDLANVLGNLISRSIQMINQFTNGIIENTDCHNDQKELDVNLKEVINLSIDECIKNMEDLQIAEAIDKAFDIFRRCNKYIDETTPWVLAKNENDLNRLKTVLYNLSCGIVIGSKLLYSFMPETSEKILNAFNSNITFDDLKKFDVIENGTKITNEKFNLFVRKNIEDTVKSF